MTSIIPNTPLSVLELIVYVFLLDLGVGQLDSSAELVYIAVIH